MCVVALGSYRGVMDDYWHSGYKRERPYVCVYGGKYHGRFATAVQVQSIRPSFAAIGRP